MAFTSRYRACAAAIAASQRRTFFETGGFGGKYDNVSAFNAYRGAAPAQMARAQVVAMLGGFLANRQNEFRDTVTRSSLSAEIKHALHTINHRKAWFSRQDVVVKGETAPIPPEVRRLARCIMRAVLRRHRRPNARGIAPVLDVRAVKVAPAASARRRKSSPRDVLADWTSASRHEAKSLQNCNASSVRDEDVTTMTSHGAQRHRPANRSRKAKASRVARK